MVATDFIILPKFRKFAPLVYVSKTGQNGVPTFCSILKNNLETPKLRKFTLKCMFRIFGYVPTFCSISNKI